MKVESLFVFLLLLLVPAILGVPSADQDMLGSTTLLLLNPMKKQFTKVVDNCYSEGCRDFDCCLQKRSDMFHDDRFAVLMLREMWTHTYVVPGLAKDGLRNDL